MSVISKGLMRIHGHTNAVVFQVETDIGPVYMSFNETTCMDRRSVSIVDAGVFVALWRASPYQQHKDIANGSLTSWRNDDKYHDAEDGFSQGISNPVPLAKVNFATEVTKPSIWTKLTNGANQHDYISFTNGITRTIWLLCNGAKSFPVEVAAHEEERLSNAAGCHGYQVTNPDLLRIKSESFLTPLKR